MTSATGVIYRIGFLPIDDCYVGMTTWHPAGRRGKLHARYLQRGAHQNQMLQYAWDECGGVETFIFQELETICPHTRKRCTACCPSARPIGSTACNRPSIASALEAAGFRPLSCITT